MPEIALSAIALWLVGNSRYDTMVRQSPLVWGRLWLVGNSRYDTMCSLFFLLEQSLWLVGNSRYDTIGSERRT